MSALLYLGGFALWFFIMYKAFAHHDAPNPR